MLSPASDVIRGLTCDGGSPRSALSPRLCHHSINSSFSHRVSNLGSDDAQSVYPSPANDTSARRLDSCQPTSRTTCAAPCTSRNHAFTGHALSPHSYAPLFPFSLRVDFPPSRLHLPLLLKHLFPSSSWPHDHITHSLSTHLMHSIDVYNFPLAWPRQERAMHAIGSYSFP